MHFNNFSFDRRFKGKIDRKTSSMRVIFTGIRTLDFTVEHSGNISVHKLYHVNFVFTSTDDLKFCDLLFNLYT